MKKEFYLRTLLAFLFLLGGASLAWGDGVTPDLEVNFRTNSGNTGWESGYPKETSNTAQFECNAQSGIFVLQRYTIEDLMKTKSITLRIVNGTGSGGDALAIWAIPATNLPIDWTKSTAVATIVSAYTSAVGIAPRATTGDINTTYLVNGTTDKSDGNKFVITGAALTRLKDAAIGNSFTLLLTNKTDNLLSNSSRKFASSGDATDANKPTVTVTESFTKAVLLSKDDAAEAEYDNIGDARTEAANATSTATITLLQDQSISARINAISGKTLNLVPGKDGVIITNTADALTFLANASQAGTINVGKAGHSLVLKNTSTLTNNIIETSGNSADAIINIENVTFKDVTTSNVSGIVKANDSNAKITLKNVTFDGCTVSAENAGFVYCNANGLVTVSSNLTFTNCTGNSFKLKGRLCESSFNANQAYTIYNDGIALGASAVVTMNATNRNKYSLVNENRCVIGKGNTGTNNEELVVSEAYTLSVSDANAATLIIPFETTIPDGVTCYTLNYTEGKSTVKKTEVETTLPANTPVLINATGSVGGTKYKFNASTRATSSTAASTEGTHTVGALTGAYAATTYVPVDSYILYNGAEGVGFYKVVTANSNKVAAYRAYLTADGAGARGFIGFDDDTTGIEELKNLRIEELNSVYYDLQGRRVLYPKKGLYIVNGKKVIMK